MDQKAAVSLNGLSMNDGMSHGGKLMEGSDIWCTSSRQFQRETESGQWNSHSDIGRSGASGSRAFARPSSIHHFGLLDVPQPDALFSANDPPGSWRGSYHMPLSIPEASELVPTMESNGMASQPIRPKAVSRNPHGEVSSIPRASHHHKPVQMRSGMAASNMEGSATSDDHDNSHSRLIPKRGQGPGLRSEGGGKIDEYLMRLLHNGRTSSETTEKRTSDGTTQRHVSRLGPLAGAGVMSSSVQRAGSGKIKVPEKSKTLNGIRQRQDVTDTATEPKPEQPKTTHTKPSTAGVNRDRASQENSLSVPAIKRKASMDPERLRSEHARYPVKEEAKRGHVEKEQNKTIVPETDGQIADAHTSLKRQMGLDSWSNMRDVISQQIKEFHQQVTELHRLKDLQFRLQLGRASTQNQHLQPSKQQGSGGSSRPSWRTNTNPNTPNGASLNGATTGGTSSLATPSWLPDVHSLCSGGAAEAFSWPVMTAQQQPSTTDPSRKQMSDPVKGVSQTTQLAMDAQRMRRRLRHISGSKGSSQQASKPHGLSVSGTPVNSDAPMRVQSSSEDAMQPRNPMASAPNQSTGGMPQLGMWNPFVQHQMMAAQQAFQFGPQGPASMGNLMEMTQRHNSAQLEAFKTWSKQQQAAMHLPNTSSKSHNLNKTSNSGAPVTKQHSGVSTIHPANVNTQFSTPKPNSQLPSS